MGHGKQEPPEASELCSIEAIAPYQAIPFTGNFLDYPSNVQPVLGTDSENEDIETRREAAKQIISEFQKVLAERTSCHMGYPYNLDFDFQALQGLNYYCINNLGDPFIESNYGVHSRPFEVGVLEWFARLWEIKRSEFWGYITNCGTEGNLHGIYIGRENHPDGILYASCESHYSVFKAARMYRMKLEKIPTLLTGEINYKELKKALERNSAFPAVLNVNIGTTVKGAVDDLDQILNILNDTGFSKERFYIHCDGALFGLMIPFLRRGREPMVSFKKPIGSISVSGHKFIGAPVPCGVVITRLSLIKVLSSDIEYLNSRDATIMGSRNGHAAIYMWYTLSTKGYSGLRKDVEKCLRNALLLKDMLDQLRVPAMLNEQSNTVVFERPKDPVFIKKWQLACEGDKAHVVVMPNITIDKLRVFVFELLESLTTSAKLGIQNLLVNAQLEQPKQ
eukprot:g6615.t1